MPAPAKPEIMSPAGYWPQLRAAIEAGADAVYFGLKHFTARAKVGFGLEELPEVMRTLHSRGVKGYVTFNTLVFDHELSEAARALAAIAEAGADSIIVQDLGIVQLARQIAPDLAIHGSTQMSITSAEGVELARSLGVSRVVLARELSLDDIRTIRSQTTCALEIFVHGALCVSYSGQCFSSEAWGGRSANRGQCAQACRLPYELIVDGRMRPLDDARYLLSPGDLYALPLIKEIVRIGISSLKIEGRYKDADYVALTTSAYRKAVDEAWAGLPISVDAKEQAQLEQVYSRGLGPYFLSGTNHQEVVKGRSPRHRGVFMGHVRAVLEDGVVISPGGVHSVMPLKPGDGVVFDAADWRSPEQHEEGGRVYEISARNDGTLLLRFAHDALDFSRIRAGDMLWRTDDPDLERMARVYTDAKVPVHKQPLHVRVTAHAGSPLRTEWRLTETPSIRATVESDAPLPEAKNRGMEREFVDEQLGRLGNTPYALHSLELEMSGTPFAPSSLLNQMRRQAVELLSAAQCAPSSQVTHSPGAILEAALRQGSFECRDVSKPKLHLLVRSSDQLEAAIESRPDSITLDYLELYGLQTSVDKVHASGIEARVASPRVLKPSEQRIVHFLLKLGCPIVVRSAGLLHALREQDHPALIGDFSLNAANQVTAGMLLRMGLSRLTPTHDLNAAQIGELAGNVGAQLLEAVAYQHLPVFHTEHCVFCRFLSKGTSFEDCGHPCEKHRVSLKDPQGRSHPVMADVGCRNTVFGAEAQEASRHIEDWLRFGIRHFRLEFVHESGDAVGSISDAFRRLLDGQISSEELGITLSRISPQGATQGSLYVPANYLSLPVLQ